MAAETIELLLLGHTTIFFSWHLLCHSSVLLLNGHLEWATHGLLLSSCRMILRSLIIGFSSLTGQYFSLATFCWISSHGISTTCIQVVPRSVQVTNCWSVLLFDVASVAPTVVPILSRFYVCKRVYVFRLLTAAVAVLISSSVACHTMGSLAVFIAYLLLLLGLLGLEFHLIHRWQWFCLLRS